MEFLKENVVRGDARTLGGGAKIGQMNSGLSAAVNLRRSRPALQHPAQPPQRSEMHAGRADGTHPRRLVAAPAAYPRWSPQGEVTPPVRPILRLRRDGATFQLQIDQLAPGPSRPPCFTFAAGGIEPHDVRTPP